MQPSPELRYRFNHATLKIYKEDADRGHFTYKVYLAKNDSDGCTLTFWENNPLEELHLVVDKPVNKNGDTLDIEVFRFHYISIRKRPLPDAMVPDAGTFAVARNESQSFFLRITAQEDAVPGLYTSTFTVRKDGEIMAKGEFSAHVWDFALPKVPTCGTLFGLSKKFIETRHEVSEAEAEILYKKYYDYLLDNKICCDDLPYDLLDDRADEYFNNDKVKNFRIPYAKDDETILAYRKKLSSNPKWLEKGLFYPVDEPSHPEKLEHYRQVVTRLEKLWPDFQIITPLGDSRLFPQGHDNISFLGSHQTHWCLRSDMFGRNGTEGYVKDEFAAPEGSVEEVFGTVLERMKKERESGRSTWWYVCGFPYLMSYCDLNLDNTGAQHRLLFWQQFAYDVEGLLYWSANSWGMEGTPWDDPFNFDKIHHGDGTILYNGNAVGIDGPVGSMRLEMIRSGVEDFEYLTMAKELLTKEQLEAITNPIVNPTPAMNQALYGSDGPDIYLFSDNDDAFYEARYKLGSAIEKALNDK